MSGEMNVNSVNAAMSSQPKDETKRVAEETKKPIIEVNFTSEIAETAYKAGLPVMGLGIELGARAGDKAKENLKESVDRNAKFAEEHPILSRIIMGPLTRHIIIAFDKWFE